MLEDLRSRLRADHALQISDQRRIGSRADRRADHVVRVSHVFHPVADRRRGRLLQRPRARVHGRDGGAQQRHALDVGMLAARVLGAHVDDALQVQQRAHRRGRHAMLAGAGLGDDPPLAHPLGQERLAERVVELVRARVVEVLALEIHAATHPRGQPPRAIKRRRAPAEVAQQPVQVVAICRVRARRDPGALQLRERRHQRLGDVLAPVVSEPVLDRRGPLRRAHAAAPSTGAPSTGAVSAPVSASGAGACVGAASARVEAIASKNARSFASSLCPGARSVPLAVSTA